MRFFLFFMTLLLPAASTWAAGAILGCAQFGGYPWVQDGCLNSPDLNNAVDLSIGPLPPQNSFGQGAQQGHGWLDTSGVPATWRICVNPAGCAIGYVPNDWLRVATVNLAARTIVPAGAGYTVATLPAAVIGDRAYVTDQLTTCAVSGGALTGGGVKVCPVFYNGTAWVGG